MSIKEMPYAPDSKEAMPLAHYRELFEALDPAEIAQRCQIPYDPATRQLTVTLLGKEYKVSHPDFAIEGEPTSPQEQILFLRYFVEGKRMPYTRFVTYRELPWGEVYIRQFTGRCITRLAFSWANRQQQFAKVMEALDAKPVPMGDCAYQLEFMPGLFIQMIVWAGDDEFPPNAQILLSDNFSFAFHTEDVAYVGEIALGRMKKLGAKL